MQLALFPSRQDSVARRERLLEAPILGKTKLAKHSAQVHKKACNAAPLLKALVACQKMIAHTANCVRGTITWHSWRPCREAKPRKQHFKSRCVAHIVSKIL